MNDASNNTNELPMHDRVELALREAALQAILDHKRTGDPVVIWRDGKVVHVPAEELLKELADAAEKNGAAPDPLSSAG
jgi:hypothetical protein